MYIYIFDITVLVEVWRRVRVIATRFNASKREREKRVASHETLKPLPQKM